MIVSSVGSRSLMDSLLIGLSSLYGDWFHAFVMATCISREKTMLVEKFAKTESERVIFGDSKYII